jgi:ribokinase
MNKKIAVVGSINMDMVVNIPYMPGIGETILAEKFKTVSGGKGANQAYAAARLGGDVYMFGKVGSDQFSGPLIKSLISAGVNTRGIKKDKEAQTGLAFINVNAEGDNNIVVVPGANGTYSEADLEENRDLFDLCEIILLQLEIPLPTVFHTVKLAFLADRQVIFNPAPAPKRLPPEILKQIDIITPNKNELERLTGLTVQNPEQAKNAARELIAGGVKTVIVTLGEEGAALISNDNYMFYPAHKVKVVDTTAAGDCFSAAIAVALAKGEDLSEAIIFANKVAALAVTREGAQTSIPTLSEVLNHNFN